jgi:hypothetical protein
MIPQDLVMVAARLRDPASVPRCSRYPLVQLASSPTPDAPLHPTLVAEDPTDQDAWAIVRMDWDYPPYLRPLDAGRPDSEVQARLLQGRLEVTYSYAQQDGVAEAASLVRVYQLATDGSRCLLGEGRGTRLLDLPDDFSGTVQASVVPSSQTKAGREYFAPPLRVGNAGQAPDVVSCVSGQAPE